MNLLEYQKNLDKVQIKPVNLIHGEEEYIVKTFLDKLKEKAQVRILWGDELSLQDFLNEVGTGGMFSRKEVLFVYRAEDFLKRIKDVKAFLSYLTKLDNKKVFFYVGLRLGEKDLQKEPYLSLSKLGDVLVASKLDRKRIRELVKNKLQREGISIEESALDYLLEATAYQLTLLKNETDKLLLYGKKHLTLEDIKRSVVAEPEMTVFDFVDALFLKDYARALDALKATLRAGTHPLQVLYLLVNYTLKLFTAKVLVEGGQDVEKALTQVDIKHKFQLASFKRYMSENSLNDLFSMLRRLQTLDVAIKVYFVDPAQALRSFVVEYMLNEEGSYYASDAGDQNRADAEP